MQRHSWTNNRQPLFSTAPCRAHLLFEHDFSENRYPPRIKCGAGFFRIMLLSRGFEKDYGRRFRRTATCEGRQLAAHADRDFGGALAQPFSFVRAADAVSVPQRATWRRL